MNPTLLSQLNSLDAALAARFVSIHAYLSANLHAGQDMADYNEALDAGLEACIAWYNDPNIPFLANGYIQAISAYAQVREAFPDAMPPLVNSDHRPESVLDQGNFIGQIRNAPDSYWRDASGQPGGVILADHFDRLVRQIANATGLLAKYTMRMNTRSSALQMWQTFEELEVNEDYANENIRNYIFNTLGWDSFLKSRGLHDQGVYSYPRAPDFQVAVLEPTGIDPEDPLFDPTSFIQYITPGDVPFAVRDGHFKLLFSPSGNVLSWDAGSVTFMSDHNNAVEFTINSGSATYVGLPIYISYIPGVPDLQVSTNLATAYLARQSIVAIYNGGVDLRTFNATRIIVGSEVAINSMPADRIADGDLIAKVRVGNAGDLFLNGSGSNRKIHMGSNEETPMLVIGRHTEPGFDASAGGYRFRKSDGSILFDSEYGLGPDVVGSANIKPGAVREYHLYFGARSIEERGITISIDPDNDRILWSSGIISWYDDLGNNIETSIIGGMAVYDGDSLYIVWEKGADRFTATTDPEIAFDNENYYVFAQYNGGNNIFRNFQSTMIDGNRITTGTIDLNRLKADSALVTDMFIGDETFRLSGTNRNLRIKDDLGQDRLIAGQVEPGVYGVKIYDESGNVYMDVTSGTPTFARDAEITGSLKFIGEFAEAPDPTLLPINSVYRNITDGNTYRLEYISDTSGPKHWVAFSLAGLPGADGEDGADGVDAKAVKLTIDTQTFSYDSFGLNVNPTSTTVYAEAINTSGVIYYEFFINDISVQNTTSNFYNYVPPANFVDMPQKVEVQLRELSTVGAVVARDQISVIGVRPGKNAIFILLTNESHTIPSPDSGEDYNGSGTDIRVWEGVVAVPYDASLDASPSFRVTPSATNITTGSAATISDVIRRFANHSAMTEVRASIVYSIEVKNSDGEINTYVRVQSLAKSLQGVPGEAGEIGERGSKWFYATGTSWSDTVANNAITAASFTKVELDTVTIFSTTTGFSQTRVWSGGSWNLVEQVIDGSLVVKGSIFGDAIAAQTITATNLAIGNRELINPDSEFRDMLYHGVISGSSVNSANGPGVHRTLTNPGNFDVTGNYFPIEQGAVYRVRLWLWLSSTATGKFAPVVHFPFVAWAIPAPTNTTVVDGLNGINLATTAIPKNQWVHYDTFVTASHAACWQIQERTAGESISGVVAYKWEIYRATSANLIVDGSINAAKMSAAFGTFQNYIRVGETDSETDATFIAGNSYNTQYRIWAGHVNPTSAKFSVSKNGKVIAQDLEIYNNGELVFSSTSGFTDFGRNLILINSGTLVNPLVEVLVNNTDYVPVTLTETTEIEYTLNIPSMAQSFEYAGGWNNTFPPTSPPADPWPSSITLYVQRAVVGGSYSNIKTVTLTKGVHYEIITDTVSPVATSETDPELGTLYLRGTRTYTLIGKAPYLGAGNSVTINAGTDTTTVSGGSQSFEFRVNSPYAAASRTLIMRDANPGIGFIRTDAGSSGGSVTNADLLNNQPGAYYTNMNNASAGTLSAARGGTGIGSYTAGNYLRADTSSTLEQRTPSQVLGDLGAAPVNNASFTGYTIVPALIGRTFVSTSVSGTLDGNHLNRQIFLNGNITVPSAVATQGDAIFVTADNSDRTITRGSGLTMYVNGVNTASVTIPANTSMGIKFSSGSVCEILGISTGGGGGGSFDPTASQVISGQWDFTQNVLLSPVSGTPAARLHIEDENNAGYRYDQFSASDGANHRTGRARGTIASPSAVQSGDRIFALLGRGYHSGGGWSAYMGGIELRAAENFSPTGQGTYLAFTTSAIGTTSGQVERMRITSQGFVGINTDPRGRFEIKTGADQNLLVVPNSNGADAGRVALMALNDANSGYTPMGYLALNHRFWGTAIFENETLSSAYNVVPGDGNGLKFWNSGQYSIFMASSAHSGRAPGETTSDYNIYLRMTGGTNRGWVFKNDATNVAGIDGSGKLWLSGGLQARKDVSGGIGPALALSNQGGGAGTGSSIDFIGAGTQSVASRIYSSDDGAWAHNLIFYTKLTGASGNSLVERFRLASNGSHQLAGDLTVSNAVFANNWYRSYGDTGWFSQTYSGGIYMVDTTWVRVYNNKGFYSVGDIASANNIIAYYSDERLKTRVGKIENALERIRKLDGFFYVNNELAKGFGYNNEKIQVGLSAQQLKEVLPEVVTLAPFDMETHRTTGEITSKSGENYMTVFYEKVVPLLVEGIKEQQDHIEKQGKEINNLKEELGEIRQILKKLKRELR